MPRRRRLQAYGESVPRLLEGCRLASAEHVGGHMGDDDAPWGELVPVGVEVGEAQVVGNVLVPVVGLGDEQIGVFGKLGQRVRPGGVAERAAEDGPPPPSRPRAIGLAGS